MNMPGFTAETSLYRLGEAYRGLATPPAPPGGTVRPQACDPQCLSDCQDACSDPDLPPRFRIACLRQCRQRCCPPPPVCGPCVGTRTCRQGGGSFDQPCSC